MTGLVVFASHLNMGSALNLLSAKQKLQDLNIDSDVKWLHSTDDQKIQIPAV